MELLRIDLKIGEKFKYKNKTITAIESNGTCKGCCLRKIWCVDLSCIYKYRKDRRNVIFVEVKGIEENE